MLSEVKVNYSEPVCSVKQRNNIFTEVNEREKRKKRYFLKQKGVGIGVILLAVTFYISIPFEDIATTFFWMFILIGSGLITSKSEILTLKDWEGWR